VSKKEWTLIAVAYLVGSFFGVGALLGLFSGFGSKANAAAS
jgi:hypothetical protein